MKVVSKPVFFEKGCAAALGTFDGVHLGHKSVIASAVASSFAPVAIIIMQNGRKKHLFSDSLNLSYIESLGIDTAVCLDLDEICGMQPHEYLYMLYRQMNVRFFACGSNHRFGKAATGTFDDISAFCAEHSIDCKKADTVTVNGMPVSSTAVRECVACGDMESARELMGHDYKIDFPVVHGDSRGREMGFPTINQPYPDGFVLPKFGVYAAVAEIDGKEYPAVSNVGIRPTYLADTPLAETHLIGYSGDLYGKGVTVAFKQFMRPERKFDSPDELISAIADDKSECMKILSGRK